MSTSSIDVWISLEFARVESVLLSTAPIIVRKNFKCKNSHLDSRVLGVHQLLCRSLLQDFQNFLRILLGDSKLTQEFVHRCRVVTFDQDCRDNAEVRRVGESPFLYTLWLVCLHTTESDEYCKLLVPFQVASFHRYKKNRTLEFLKLALSYFFAKSSLKLSWWNLQKL